MSNRELSAEFLASFKTASAAVSQHLSTDTIAVDAIKSAQLELVKLRKSLVLAEEFLPRYDQRQVDEQLRSLEALLESKKAKSAPKPRFAFKKAAPGARLTPPTPPPAAPVASAPDAPVVTDNVKLTSLSNAFVSLPSDLPSSGYSVSLSSLSHCVINLLPAPRQSSSSSTPPITALHIQNLTSCILFAPPIEGSVLINGLANCTLVLGCWQLRMHHASWTDVFVRMTAEGGTPVIEECERTRFGPYLLGTASDPPQPPLTVLDFSHPNPTTPSPNFTLLALDDVERARTMVATALSLPSKGASLTERVQAAVGEWAAAREACATL